MLGLNFDEDNKEDRLKIKKINIVLFSAAWLISLFRYVYL